MSEIRIQELEEKINEIEEWWCQIKQCMENPKKYENETRH